MNKLFIYTFFCYGESATLLVGAVDRKEANEKMRDNLPQWWEGEVNKMGTVTHRLITFLGSSSAFHGQVWWKVWEMDSQIFENGDVVEIDEVGTPHHWNMIPL